MSKTNEDNPFSDEKALTEKTDDEIIHKLEESLIKKQEDYENSIWYYLQIDYYDIETRCWFKW